VSLKPIFKNAITLFIFWGFSALNSQATWAESSSFPCADHFARLQHAIDTDDIVHDNPTLPPEIRVDSAVANRSDVRKLFILSRDLWERGFNRKALKFMIRKVEEGEALSQRESDEFRQVRAYLKQLRAAFIAFDKHHEAPKHLDELAAQMGHVSDAVKNGKKRRARREAEALIDLLSRGKITRVEEEIRSFEPANRQSFVRWLNVQGDKLEENLGELKMTPKQFHDTRKVISRVVAAYDVMSALAPSEHAEEMIRYLSTLNGKMGTRHDVLIAQSLNDGLDYEHDLLIVSDDILGPARALARKLQEAR
jgi:hypothetical protein